MEIILLQDVKTLGKKGDVVKVNDGYARNMLLPKKLGIEANPKNMEVLKKQKAEEERIAAEQLAEAKKLGENIGSKKVTIQIKAGGNGKAFGSVTSKEIGQAMKDQLALDIDKKKIVLTDAIKTAGEFDIPVKLHPQVTAKIKVIVETV